MKSFFIALSVGGGRPRKSNDLPPRALRWRRCSSECEVAPLGIGIQAMQLSPYHAGLAGRHLQRLPVSPAFPTCSFPLRLSPSGQSDDPGATLRAPPDWVRDSTPRSAAHRFRVSGSPVNLFGGLRWFPCRFPGVNRNVARPAYHQGFLAAIFDDEQRRFSVSHVAYLHVLPSGSPAPLRHVSGFPGFGLLWGLRRHRARAP